MLRKPVGASEVSIVYLQAHDVIHVARDRLRRLALPRAQLRNLTLYYLYLSFKFIIIWLSLHFGSLARAEKV